MKFKLLLVSTLIFCFFAKAQNLNEETLMGKWNTVNVEILNDVPQKEAVKFIKDAFSGSKFNFKGNKVFKIKYGKTADERIKELFFIDNQNWVIDKNQIKIGTETDGFSSMHILVQKEKGKTYFILPMIRLEMKKVSDDKPTKAKVVKSKIKKTVEADYSKVEFINKEIDKSQIIRFDEAENPPLANYCNSNWDSDKKRKCTNKFIQRHIMTKFNTGLAADIGLTGKIRMLMEFIIDTNGNAINIKVSGGPDLLNKNVMAVIGLLPNLKPGTQNGKPINVSCKMPLNFYVED